MLVEYQDFVDIDCLQCHQMNSVFFFHDFLKIHVVGNLPI